MLFVFIFFYVLINIPTVLCAPNAPIVYVAADGSGDFNCSSSNANVQINQALQYVVTHPEFTTVYLKGPATYVISDTLVMGNNTTLKGDPSATIKLASNANWQVTKSMVQISGSHDIVLSGFSINGNREGNTNVHSGGNYYNVLGITNSQNIDVNHMTLTNNHDDGIEMHTSTNLKYHDNTLYLLGHDGLYACDSSDIEAYNNNITCRTNSGLRAYNTNHVSFHDNTITSQGSGGAGIEIQKEDNDTLMDDIEIYNNVIHNTVHAGIWIFGSSSYPASSTFVHVHHNIIYDTGTNPQNGITGGILSDGFNGLIENNIIDGTYSSGIAQGNIYPSPLSGSGFMLTIRNNIVTNTKSGYGIENTLTKTHSFILQNNCFHNNLPGNANGVSLSATDIVADPLFVNASNHDYHLQSMAGHWNGNEWANDSVTSPCIDAGYPQSDYSNEPQCNGNRINIGAYGNTICESKSPAYDPIVPIFPSANFSNNVTSGYVPLYVQFTDYSGNATGWSWNFGDGATSTQQNPLHIFATAGTYTVSLTASNANGTSSTSAQIVVSAKPVIPVAAYTVSSTTGIAPLRITFTDKSTGSPNIWIWNFGDNTNSTIKNPTHTYSKAGRYTVILTVTNSAGSNTMTKSNYIVVNVLKPPVAAFTASPLSGQTSLTVTFADKSTNNPTSWSWDFGDKSTSTEKNPVHKYTKAGKYTVSLTVKNTAGSNTKKISNYVTVRSK